MAVYLIALPGLPAKQPWENTSADPMPLRVARPLPRPSVLSLFRRGRPKVRGLVGRHGLAIVIALPVILSYPKCSSTALLWVLPHFTGGWRVSPW